MSKSKKTPIPDIYFNPDLNEAQRIQMRDLRAQCKKNNIQLVESTPVPEYHYEVRDFKLIKSKGKAIVLKKNEI